MCPCLIKLHLMDTAKKVMDFIGGKQVLIRIKVQDW